MLLFLKIVESFCGCYCPIIFEWCVWVQRCVSLVDDSSGMCVCGWVGVFMGACGGGDARKACFVVG